MTLGSLTTLWTAIAIRGCRALCVVAVIMYMWTGALPVQPASALDGSSVVLAAGPDQQADATAADLLHQHGRCACHAQYLAAPEPGFVVRTGFAAYFMALAPVLGSHSPPPILRPPERLDQTAV